MAKIETGKCKRNHLFLAYKECPFCCAMDGTTPTETDQGFLKIYNDIKDMTIKEITQYYQNYLPTEPDESKEDIINMFK